MTIFTYEGRIMALLAYLRDKQASPAPAPDRWRDERGTPFGAYPLSQGSSNQYVPAATHFCPVHAL